MDGSERARRLQRVYEAQDSRELASSYDEWAQNYENDMLSLGYAIPAVAAGFVGRHVPSRGTALDAGAGTGMFGSILRVLDYEDLVGMDISERMLEIRPAKSARTAACTAWRWVSLWVSKTTPSRPPSPWGSSRRTTPR